MLYHYTGLDHLEGIRRDGLTLGMLPLWAAGGWQIRRGYQWLTDDPNWKQGWATDQIGACGDRTSVRVAVEVPESERRNLFRWNTFALAVLGLDRHALDSFNAAGGSDGQSWWVYRGPIPVDWLREWESKPEAL